MKPCSFGALLAALLLLPTCALAAYRCERHGQVTYTDQRCSLDEDGAGNDLAVEREIVSARASPISNQRAGNGSEGNEASAAVRLQRERAELARLQALREQRERQDRQIRDLAARGAAARERKCRALALQRQWREEDLRDAPLEKAAKARTRLRRANEKYAAECP